MSSSVSSSPAVVDVTAAQATPRPHTVIENVKGNRIPLTCPDYVDDAAINLSDNSIKVLEKRYLRRDYDGSLLETSAGMFYRVAYHIAQVEKEHNGDPVVATRAFYDLLAQRRFFPNSPTFTGAGTPLGQLAACFVLPIEDDMGRSSDGIFSTLRVAALIQQTGGGNGFSFSRLRPKGDVVLTSSGRATGPLGFLRVYDQAFGEIAQGGCLTPETLVFTNAGLLRLDELVDTAKPGWRDHQLTVATDDGERTSPRGYNNGVQPVVKVHTQEGLALTGTRNHKVKVMTVAGPTWRRLDELQPGDAILVTLGQHQGRLRALRRPQRTHGNQSEIGFPPLLDELLAFLLGYMAGDGFVASAPDDHRLGFSVAHSSYLLEELPKLLQATFPGCVIHRQQKPNDASVTFVLDSALIKQFLLDNGLAKPKSHEVYVPRLVRQSPPNVVGAYLRGLFEADGRLSHHYPLLSSTSERLAQEVATLLIGLGCPVTLRSLPADETRLGSRIMWEVRINSHVGLEVWREKVGCDQRSRFVGCYAFQPDIERESSYVLPHAGWWVAPVLEEITLPQHDRKGRGQGVKWQATDPRLRRKLLRYVRGDRALTISAYRDLSAAYPEFAQQAQPVNNLWFVHVTEIQPAGEALTLDLEVEDNHTYVANGLVTHNSRRGANMAVLRVDHPDIEQFIECKAEEGTIANFNISVAITDAFMQAVKDDTDFELVNPRNGKVWKTVRATELFAKIIKYAHHNGEPGALFIDAANRTNPVPHLYELEATNPCHRGTNLVHTDRGVVPIRELVGRDFCVVTPDGAIAQAVAYVTGEKPLYRVHLDNGATIDLTENHNLILADGAKKMVRDLEAGDRVQLAKHPIEPSRTPCEFGESEGFLLGWNAGDGWLTYHTNSMVQAWQVGFVFGNQDAEIAQRVVAQVQEQIANLNVVLNRVPALKLRPERGVLELATTNKEFTHYFRDSLGAIHKSQGVPATVLQGNRNYQRGYLCGLFSADGYVSIKGRGRKERRQLGLVTAHEQLARDVQVLLSTFGIRARLRHSVSSLAGRDKHYERWQLTVNADQFVAFMERVGFAESSAKQVAAKAVLGREWRATHSADTAAVVTVEGLGIVEEVYNLTVNHPLHAFAVNGIVSANCGEQWLGPYENCCLGSINLTPHVTVDATGQAGVDWELLRRSIEESTHFLENVVSANAYVPSVPAVAEAAYRARRIGLGIMGLGDMMYLLGIRYGSEEGQEFAAQIMEFVRYHAMAKSIALAEARGPFLAFDGSIYDPKQPGGMQWQLPAPMTPYRRNWSRPPVDWQAIVAGIQRHGLRNAAQTTVAPTGTIATVVGCEGYGCEPVFALGYIRHFKDGDRDVELEYTSPLFNQALEAADLSAAEKAHIRHHVAAYGACQDMPGLPEQLRHTFVVSSDITAEEHVLMQAAIQAFTDNSISKTVNFPEGATEQDVATAYMLAWETGCKGLTVYVTGSRQVVVLETKATKGKKEEPVAVVDTVTQNGTNGYHTHDRSRDDDPDVSVQLDVKPTFVKRPRPTKLHGATYRKDTPLGTAYITVNSDERDEPFEVFLNVGKAGTEVTAVSEAMGRLISLVLRMPASLPPSERLRWVMDEMAGIGGGRPLGFGVNRVRSLPDGVAQVLAEHLSQLPPMSDELQAEQLALPMDTKPIGDICPDCGEASFLNVEGCRKCHICGYSEC